MSLALDNLNNYRRGTAQVARALRVAQTISFVPAADAPSRVRRNADLRAGFRWGFVTPKAGRRRGASPSHSLTCRGASTPPTATASSFRTQNERRCKSAAQASRPEPSVSIPLQSSTQPGVNGTVGGWLRELNVPLSASQHSSFAAVSRRRVPCSQRADSRMRVGSRLEVVSLFIPEFEAIDVQLNARRSTRD